MPGGGDDTLGRTTVRHYEVVFLVHPDQSDQVPGMIERYRNLVERWAGKVHRLEDWSRRQLAYPIAKMHKAHFVLMNIEVSQEGLAELQSAFKFNDAVLRNLIIRRKGPIVAHSKIYEAEMKEQERERDQRRSGADAKAPKKDGPAPAADDAGKATAAPPATESSADEGQSSPEASTGEGTSPASAESSDGAEGANPEAAPEDAGTSKSEDLAPSPPVRLERDAPEDAGAGEPEDGDAGEAGSPAETDADAVASAETPAAPTTEKDA